MSKLEFNGWAIIDLPKGIRESGRVSTEYFGNTPMFRILVPEIEELVIVDHSIIENLGWIEVPRGVKLKRYAQGKRILLVGLGSITLTPCDEDTARADNERRNSCYCPLMRLDEASGRMVF